jgi:hypothetical protein
MTAPLIRLRPTPPPTAKPSPSSSQPSPTVPIPSRSRPGPSAQARAAFAVHVEWDGIAGLHIAVCRRCCETFTTHRFDQAHEWAETHTCDPEFVALLDAVTRQATRAA